MPRWATRSYQRDMPGAAQVYDLVMAYGFNIMQGLVRRALAPRRSVRSPTPSPKDAPPIPPVLPLGPAL